MSVTSREQLHQQIDQLPDHIVEPIVNFASSMITKKNNIPEYSNWEDKDWQEFSLQIFSCKKMKLNILREKLILWLQN